MQKAWATTLSIIATVGGVLISNSVIATHPVESPEPKHFTKLQLIEPAHGQILDNEEVRVRIRIKSPAGGSFSDVQPYVKLDGELIIVRESSRSAGTKETELEAKARVGTGLHTLEVGPSTFLPLLNSERIFFGVRKAEK